MSETSLHQSVHEISRSLNGTRFEDENVLDFHRSQLSPVDMARTAVAGSYRQETQVDEHEQYRHAIASWTNVLVQVRQEKLAS